MKRDSGFLRRSRRPSAGFFIALLFSVFSVQTAFASDDARSLFNEAIRLKETGQAAETSRDLFAKSAELFEDEATRDWHLWYEAGNARWWALESDRAAADYRRYLAHDYFRGEVWENLAEARRSAQTENPGNEGFSAWPWPLWFVSAAALVAGLGALAFSIFLFLKKTSAGKRSWLHVSVACASIALAFALAGGISYVARGKIAIVARETPGRKGDSSVYAVWPATPWKAGQEVFIDETRDTWTLVRVGKTVSWVPSDCLIRIDGR